MVLRTLLLFTTNNLPGDLNPALLRPGRCMARVHFGPLAPEEAASVAGRPVGRQMTLAEALALRGAIDVIDVPVPPVSTGLYL